MFLEKVKEKFKIDDKNGNKKQIENIVFLIILLIIVVIVINKVWNGGKQEGYDKSNDKILAQTIEEKNNKTSSSDYYNLQQSLEQILESIEGVGDVKVLINYSETSSVVALYNETVTESSTEEKDTSGGTRNINQTDTQKEIAYSEQNGNSEPITQKVIMPTIEGAIVTAKGASNANIKADIISAVEAVTGLATHKIQVFEMGKN